MSARSHKCPSSKAAWPGGTHTCYIWQPTYHTTSNRSQTCSQVSEPEAEAYSLGTHGLSSHLCEARLS